MSNKVFMTINSENLDALVNATTSKISYLESRLEHIENENNIINKDRYALSNRVKEFEQQAEASRQTIEILTSSRDFYQSECERLRNERVYPADYLEDSQQ